MVVKTVGPGPGRGKVDPIDRKGDRPAAAQRRGAQIRVDHAGYDQGGGRKSPPEIGIGGILNDGPGVRKIPARKGCLLHHLSRCPARQTCNDTRTHTIRLSGRLCIPKVVGKVHGSVIRTEKPAHIITALYESRGIAVFNPIPKS